MHDDEHLVRVSDSSVKNGIRLAGVGAVIGGFLSFSEAFGRPVSSSVLHILGRAGIKFILPGVVIGAVYGSTTCLLDTKRGKDKPLSNSVIGGCIAGLAVGTKSHNPKTCLLMGLGFGMAGLFARGAFVGVFESDEKERFEAINSSLNMKRIAHLAPQQSQRQ